MLNIFFILKVSDNVFIGYPNPGLNQIFFIAKSIMSWLNNDQKNIAIIHCQESKGRTAVIISCLLCLMKKFHHPAEALTFFCSVLNIKTLSIKNLNRKQKLMRLKYYFPLIIYI